MGVEHQDAVAPICSQATAGDTRPSLKDVGDAVFEMRGTRGRCHEFKTFYEAVRGRARVCGCRPDRDSDGKNASRIRPGKIVVQLAATLNH